ncbi:MULTISPECIES: stage II sporulation protein P [Bacillus]|uniref:stage II sporulation protein P n=1 Tax=Bacillus TaxID=1386 RepID=UPI000CFABBD1|nr:MULTISPECIES: stage II sporulation protein P [Bacillus]PQZ52782.1 stage II sporulation protein P [Bacillus sp. MYb209]
MNKIKLKVLNLNYIMICILFTIICILTSFFISSNSNLFKSFYINQLLGTNSTKGLMYMIGSENHYFVEEFHKEKGQASLESFLLSISTNININDLRSILSRELPNMNQFYSEILIAGEGTDYTNIPEESNIPLENIKNEGSAIGHQNSEKENNSTGKSSNLQNNSENKVFIYHTHSWESFIPLIPGATKPNDASSTNNEVNISFVGGYLKQKLEEKGIGVSHDTTNMRDFLRNKNLNWAQSYKGSRQIVQDILAKDKNIMFPIDLHRDDARKNITLKTINGKNYARLYFILGRNNPNYEKNKKIVTAINSYLDEKYYGLSRGIFIKDRTKGDGVYNQDLSPNALLIEMGGVDNTPEELYASGDALVEAFSHYYYEVAKKNN